MKTFKEIPNKDLYQFLVDNFQGVRISTLTRYLQFLKNDTSIKSCFEASEADMLELKVFCEKPKAERHSLLYRFTIQNRYGPDYYKQHREKENKTKELRYGKDFNKELMQRSKDIGLRNDPDMQKHNTEKRLKTVKEKYGEDFYFKNNKKVAQRAILIKKQKYGEDYFSRTGKAAWEKVKSDPKKLKQKKEKREATLLERYGENATQLIWEKSRQSYYSKYGGKEQAIKLTTEKSLSTKLEKYGEYFPGLENSSKEEKEIVKFIKSIYAGEIQESARNVISPLELDIYIPEYKLAIEYNGFFWHSEKRIFNISKIEDYHEFLKISNRLSQIHLNKTKLCEEQGIRLMHILDLDWKNSQKQDILKSAIRSALGIYTKKYYARKLRFGSINTAIARKILNENHIQGAAKASKYFALFDNKSNPIQVMSFQLHSNHNYNECELNRMVTLKNVQVVGGFSKLLKNSLKALNVSSCTSYIDRSFFDGKGYYASGFKKVSETEPCYFYVYKNKIYRREFGMKRHIKQLFDRGEISYWNPNETERLNMFKNRIPRIWDCGKIKVKYELD